MSDPDYEFWASSAAVRIQDAGPNFLDVVDQQENSDQSGFYRGFTTSFRLKAGKGTWFHFPLPTPSVIGGASLALSRVTILWDCEDGARLSWATVHHGGANRIELSPRESEISGRIESDFETPHGLKIRMRRQDFAIDAPLPVAMGLQLCLYGEAVKEAGTVRFYGAGAAFTRIA